MGLRIKHIYYSCFNKGQTTASRVSTDLVVLVYVYHTERCPTWDELQPSHHMVVPEPADTCLLEWATETYTRAHTLTLYSSKSVSVWAEPHLKPGVGNMWVFEGKQLSTEQTLVVVDGLINLQNMDPSECLNIIILTSLFKIKCVSFVSRPSKKLPAADTGWSWCEPWPTTASLAVYTGTETATAPATRTGRSWWTRSDYGEALELFIQLCKQRCRKTNMKLSAHKQT